MVRSLYSGVSGLRTHQTRMDVIGNNIANVNTYGFKAGRATFKDVYYQTLSGASSPDESRGGSNPNQVGYGVQLGSIDTLHTVSGFQSTGSGLDLAIGGEGFFQVMDPAGNVSYTRAGNFRLDAAGNLTDGSGNFVLGSTSEFVIATELRHTVGTYEELISSNKKLYNNIIAAGAAATPPVDTTALKTAMDNYDKAYAESIAGLKKADITDAELANLKAALDTAAGALSTSVAGFNNNGSAAVAEAAQKASKATLEKALAFAKTNYQDKADKYDATTMARVNAAVTALQTEMDKFNATPPTPNTVNLAAIAGLQTAIDSLVPLDPNYGMAVSIGGLSETAGKNKINIIDQINKALPAGATPVSVNDLQSLAIGPNGVIEARHPQYGRVVLGRVDLATFANPTGLLQVGNSYFQETANSGTANLTSAGLGGSGSIAAGMLEMSNVDLSKEFSDMIVTQRGFQANSRIITVSDEMLNELINMKR